MKNFRDINTKLMYKDVAKVLRARLIQVGKTDDYTTEYDEIIVDMPCRLSVSHERPTEHRDDVSQKQTYHYVLFHEDKYEILPNDVVKINLRGGQEITLFAGNSFQYETGHVELSVKRRKESNQE